MSIDAVALQAEIMEAWVRVMGRGSFEINAIQAFMIVTEAGGKPIPQGVIRQRLGWIESTMSRNVRIIGQGASFDELGPKLVESFEDPDYRRRKLVRLTATGKRFVETLQSIVDKHARKAS